MPEQDAERDPVVLRLTFATRPGDATVVEATLPRDADTSDDRVLVLDPDDFGIPLALTDVSVDAAFTIPAELERVLGEALGEPAPSHLWLQLVEPFGYLGLVPWERLVKERFGVGVVRLPTMTLARRKPKDSLEVTILVAVPNPKRTSDLGTSLHGKKVAVTSRLKPSSRYGDSGRRSGPGSISAHDVDRLVHAVLRGCPRANTTINVITTPWIWHDLRAMWRGRDWPVNLHDAYQLRDAVQRSTDRGALAQTPWLRTLEAAQQGEQADVVHLVCSASVTDTAARLVVADPLSTSTNVSSRYVSLRTLMATLDEVGAWSVCLTAPPGDSVAPQLRYVASRLAELRPGPILMTDLGADPECAEVEAGYRFLYSTRPSEPPILTHGLVSCEPYRVATSAPEISLVTQVVEAPLAEQPKETAAALMAKDTTPIWVAAAQRFIEQRQVELARFEDEAADDSRNPEAAAVKRGVKWALATIQDVLESQAKRQPEDQ